MPNTSNYKEQGGARDVIGGSLDVLSGGEIDVEAGGSLKLAGTAISATADELNAAADVSSRHVALADADATITAANSGKTHTIANVSADRTFTLPAASAGLEYTFVATVGAADGHDWIFATDDAAELFYGGVLMVDTDAGPATVAPVVADQSDDDAFQVNLPQGGTWISMISDGSHWYVRGQVLSATAAAFS